MDLFSLCEGASIAPGGSGITSRHLTRRWHEHDKFFIHGP
jgi:hypothetical protein